MNNYKEVLSNLIKSIYYQFPNKIRIKSVSKNIVFELDYNTSKRVGEYMYGRDYYFGTEVKYSNHNEFIRTFKELLKVKRTLKKIYG